MNHHRSSMTRPLKLGLAWFARKWLGRTIQDRGPGGHDPLRGCVSLCGFIRGMDHSNDECWDAPSEPRSETYAYKYDTFHVSSSWSNILRMFHHLVFGNKTDNKTACKLQPKMKTTYGTCLITFLPALTASFLHISFVFVPRSWTTITGTKPPPHGSCTLSFSSRFSFPFVCLQLLNH
jgi:hypothetical protein